MNKKVKTIISVLIAIIIILVIILINHNNSYYLYVFNASKNDFSISGSATFTKSGNVLSVTDLKYTGTDINVSNLFVGFYYDDNDETKTIIAKGTPDEVNLKEYIDNITFNHFETYGYGELFSNEVRKNFYEKAYLKITYKDSDGNNQEEIIHLSGETYKSKLFYIKGMHI